MQRRSPPAQTPGLGLGGQRVTMPVVQQVQRAHVPQQQESKRSVQHYVPQQRPYLAGPAKQSAATPVEADFSQESEEDPTFNAEALTEVCGNTVTFCQRIRVPSIYSPVLSGATPVWGFAFDATGLNALVSSTTSTQTLSGITNPCAGGASLSCNVTVTIQRLYIVGVIRILVNAQVAPASGTCVGTCGVLPSAPTNGFLTETNDLSVFNVVCTGCSVVVPSGCLVASCSKISATVSAADECGNIPMTVRGSFTLAGGC
jgi:hypothetical protein